MKGGKIMKKYTKKMSVNLEPHTVEQICEIIEELQKDEKMKHFVINSSEIMRVAISRYWEDICLPFSDQNHKSS